MNSSHAQLKYPVATGGQLIGSFYSGKGKALIHCRSCNEELLPETKFCGECGSKTETIRQDFTQSTNSTAAFGHDTAKPFAMPAFAQVSQQLRKPVPPQLKQEYCKLYCLIARERAFLMLHYLLFLGSNLFGFFCAFVAYNGLVADEVTRMVIAFIPLICINVLACGCIVPIKGTKREISRLKERLTYIHYQIEYANLA